MKEHIAQYYETLYQAREGKKEYEKWTEEIVKKVAEIQATQINEENLSEITMSEMKTNIKKLKKRKATGPDDIPNEIFIYATEETVEQYRKVLNKTAHKDKTPEEWGNGRIKSTYKEKEKKLQKREKDK